MAITLHRCSGTWAKFGGHPCHRVQTALSAMGIDYEVVKEGYGHPKSRRTRTIQATGQRNFPWIEFEDGSVYREESKDMEATIRAGKLDAKRGPTAAAG
jgi:glutaredoxin